MNKMKSQTKLKRIIGATFGLAALAIVGGAPYAAPIVSKYTNRTSQMIYTVEKPERKGIGTLCRNTESETKCLINKAQNAIIRGESWKHYPEEAVRREAIKPNIPGEVEIKLKYTKEIKDYAKMFKPYKRVLSEFTDTQIM